MSGFGAHNEFEPCYRKNYGKRASLALEDFLNIKKKLVIAFLFWLYLGKIFDGARTGSSMRIIETSLRALPGVEDIDIGYGAEEDIPFLMIRCHRTLKFYSSNRVNWHRTVQGIDIS